MVNLKAFLSDNPWIKMAKSTKEGASLASILSVIEGEILLYLEKYGYARLRKLVRELDWPMAEVMMGIGALIREGLVEVRRDRFGVILQPT